MQPPTVTRRKTLLAALALCACASDADPADAPSEGFSGGKADEQGCLVVDRSGADSAPVQVIGGNLPSGVEGLFWVEPTSYRYHGPVSGSTGYAAGHEGVDYVHDRSSVPFVSVVAAAAGEVAYVRAGCPQSSTFGVNWSTRECGAGWGDHVVIDHGNNIYTRYAHLAPGSISVVVGDRVEAGFEIAGMGNTGRSDVRHLHFELGSLASSEDSFDSCGGSRSFHRIYRPTRLPFGDASAACITCIEADGGTSCAPRCEAGSCRSCVESSGGHGCIERCE